MDQNTNGENRNGIRDEERKLCEDKLFNRIWLCRVKGKVVTVHNMEAARDLEVYFHSVLTPTLDAMSGKLHTTVT